MRTMRIVFILLALCIVFSVFNCTAEDAEKQEPEKEASDATAPAAEEEMTGEALAAPEAEQVGSTGESEDDDVELVESPVTMDDLVYPTFNAVTRERAKRTVGDVNGWGVLSGYPIHVIWEYYEGILKGWDLDIDNKLDEEKGQKSVTAKLTDGDNVFTIELRQKGNRNDTMIRITKEASLSENSP